MRPVVVLLILCVATNACVARHWSSSIEYTPPPTAEDGWSRVQAIAAGTELEVRVLVKTGPPGTYRAIRPRFSAATPDTLTVVEQGESTRILPREDILMVRAKRSFFSRTPGWIAFGALAGILTIIFPGGGDLSFPIVWLYAAFPGSIPFFLGSAMETIYQAPDR